MSLILGTGAGDSVTLPRWSPSNIEGQSAFGKKWRNSELRAKANYFLEPDLQEDLTETR